MSERHLLERARLGGVIQTSVGAGAGVGRACREPLGMGRIRRGEHGGALGHALLGQAEVHVVGREQPAAAMVMLGVVPGEEDVPVSLDTWGREWVFVTPRSASRKATDFETMAWPRSA